MDVLAIGGLLWVCLEGCRCGELLVENVVGELVESGSMTARLAEGS